MRVSVWPATALLVLAAACASSGRHNAVPTTASKPSGAPTSAGPSSSGPTTTTLSAPLPPPATSGPLHLAETSGVADTKAGLLDLSAGGPSGCPGAPDNATQCLFRTTTSVMLSDAVVVGPRANTLFGPYPAVVSGNAAGTALEILRYR